MRKYPTSIIPKEVDMDNNKNDTKRIKHWARVMGLPRLRGGLLANEKSFPMNRPIMMTLHNIPYSIEACLKSRFSRSNSWSVHGYKYSGLPATIDKNCNIVGIYICIYMFMYVIQQ